MDDKKIDSDYKTQSCQSKMQCKRVLDRPKCSNNQVKSKYENTIADSILESKNVLSNNEIKSEIDLKLPLDAKTESVKQCETINGLGCAEDRVNTKNQTKLIAEGSTEKNIKRRNRQKCPLSKARLCPDCGFVSTSSKQLSYHRKYYHCPEFEQKRQNNKGEFECAECFKKFTRLSSLTDHIQIHNPNNPNICEICGRPFCTAKQLSDHKKTHSDHRPYLCELCNEGFKTKKTLKSHKVFHTRVRKYACEKCDKSYLSPTGLSEHLQSHEPVVNLECKICHNTYTSQKSLKAHLRVHDPSKRTKCTYCDKTFIGTKHKLKHMRTHPEFVPPFSCKYCAKPFFNERYVAYHIRIHHTEEKRKELNN